MQLVTITSQGQISIPAAMRKKYGLKTNSKVFIIDNHGKMSIEPVMNILDLAGSLKHKAIKGKSINEIMALEKKSLKDRYLERYKRKSSL